MSITKLEFTKEKIKMVICLRKKCIHCRPDGKCTCKYTVVDEKGKFKTYEAEMVEENCEEDTASF